ncbi:MAG TPA: ATP-binding protein [Candidatus Limnocylindrales bacterium]|nr:ATP-binding protein [Candidatus Limnocylindrales bacterium]
MSLAGPAAQPVDRSLDDLLARLMLVEERVRAAVDRRRATDPDPDDRFRGLYLSHQRAAELLDRSPAGSAPGDGASATVRRAADLDARSAAWEGAGDRVGLRELIRAFELDPIDTDLLLIALAPDLDPRFELLYGYLNDDVTRRRTSIGLALEIAGLSPVDWQARRRLGPSGRLVRGGLVEVDDRDRPFLGRPLRVPDRVTAHLLGDRTPDPALAEVIDDVPPTPWLRSRPLERALLDGLGPVYVRQRDVQAGTSIAASAAVAAGAPYLLIDLARLAAAPRPVELATVAIREARLSAAVLIVAPVEAVLDRCREIIGQLTEARWPVVVVGDRVWDPGWSRAVPLLLDAASIPTADRLGEWQAALDRHGVEGNGHTPDWLHAAAPFHLSPLQVERAARAGWLRARAEERELEAADLQAGARAQNAAGLDRLAHRIVPTASWPDLVLPPEVTSQLGELASRARQRDRVIDQWGVGSRGARGRGITALFAGESGTGKTLAAEVIAAELGLDLYVIDLSTVVDKYIGETEKNLDRIFAEADRVNGVLLFDEADAIFGKRSEVKDARDRYANVEVAYLLQRMERFDGLAILTTNLRANLDDAFTRRIDVIVDFPMPEEDARRALWRLHLTPGLPQADDLDLAFMGRRFRLSGGNIRNVCLTAAYLAAARDRPLEMADLIRGMELEYRKLGRLTVEAEFGEYFELLAARSHGG